MKKASIYFLFLLSLFLFLSPGVRAGEVEENFNPNYIISDSEMLNYNSMDVEDIQNFLGEHGSFLADYTCTNSYGTPDKTAAEIIYDATNHNYNCEGINLSNDSDELERMNKCKNIKTISPKVILVLLQKEMSLIEDPDPSQSQLDWATGYGCPDGSSCSSRWKGFGKQINSAALQFKDYMENPDHYNYRAGETYELDNPYSNQESTTIVTPENRATAALYNYTPHAYNGNYNFHKLWHSYFGSPQKYPDGSLLQVKGEPGVWLIEDGQKRPF